MSDTTSDPYVLRASATETDVTVAARHRAQDFPKSYVPTREGGPREARPKILRTKVGRATARSAVGYKTGKQCRAKRGRKIYVLVPRWEEQSAFVAKS